MLGCGNWTGGREVKRVIVRQWPMLRAAKLPRLPFSDYEIMDLPIYLDSIRWEVREE